MSDENNSLGLLSASPITKTYFQNVEIYRGMTGSRRTAATRSDLIKASRCIFAMSSAFVFPPHVQAIVRDVHKDDKKGIAGHRKQMERQCIGATAARDGGRNMKRGKVAQRDDVTTDFKTRTESVAPWCKSTQVRDVIP